MLCRLMEPMGHVKEGRICHYRLSCIEMEFPRLTGVYENSLGHLWLALAKYKHSCVLLSLLFSLPWVKRKWLVLKRLSQDKMNFWSPSEDRLWLKSAALQRQCLRWRDTVMEHKLYEPRPDVFRLQERECKVSWPLRGVCTASKFLKNGG